MVCHIKDFQSTHPCVCDLCIAADYTTRIAGEIKSLDCDGYVLKKWEKRVDKVIKYLTVAGKKALEQAGLPWEGPELKDLDRQKCGILIGSAMGGMKTFETACEALETQSKFFQFD